MKHFGSLQIGKHLDTAGHRHVQIATYADTTTYIQDIDHVVLLTGTVDAAYLPAPVEGRYLIVKRTPNVHGKCRLWPTGEALIDGGAVLLWGNWASWAAHLVADGQNWWVI